MKCYYQTLREAVQPEAVLPIKTQFGVCDHHCTPDDIHEGMFGFVCYRCGDSDLGSLTEH